MSLNTSPCVWTCIRILAKTLSEITDSIFALRIYPSVYLLFLILFVCPLMYRFAHLHRSPPIHLPQALLTARQSLTESAKSICKLHRSRLGRNRCSQGGARVAGILKTQRRQKSWKESGDVCRNKLVFWCEHLRTSKLRSLASCFNKNHVLFVVSWVPCHLGRVLFQLRNQIWSQRYIKEWWGVRSKNKIRMANMLFIQLHGGHFNANPASPSSFFSRCFSGQGVLH